MDSEERNVEKGSERERERERPRWRKGQESTEGERAKMGRKLLISKTQVSLSLSSAEAKRIPRMRIEGARGREGKMCIEKSPSLSLSAILVRS